MSLRGFAGRRGIGQVYLQATVQRLHRQNLQERTRVTLWKLQIFFKSVWPLVWKVLPAICANLRLDACCKCCTSHVSLPGLGFGLLKAPNLTGLPLLQALRGTPGVPRTATNPFEVGWVSVENLVHICTGPLSTRSELVQVVSRAAQLQLDEGVGQLSVEKKESGAAQAVSSFHFCG
jgi:hypothetical protein